MGGEIEAMEISKDVASCLSRNLGKARPANSLFRHLGRGFGVFNDINFAVGGEVAYPEDFGTRRSRLTSQARLVLNGILPL